MERHQDKGGGGGGGGRRDNSGMKRRENLVCSPLAVCVCRLHDVRSLPSGFGKLDSIRKSAIAA